MTGAAVLTEEVNVAVCVEVLADAVLPRAARRVERLAAATLRVERLAVRRLPRW